MEEYISKVDAEDAVEYANGNMTWAERDDCKKRLEELSPADVVQVVRCDDCVYYGSRRWCELHSSVFDDNAFCSYGEKKGG